MKVLARTASVLAVAILGLVGGLTPAHADSTPRYQSFVALGAVTNTDIQPVTPTGEGFIIGPPATVDPVQLEPAKNPDGSLTVMVYAGTKYYKYDSSISAYRPATYAQVIQMGNELKVAGKFLKAADGTFEVLANLVYAPPMTTTSTPAPQPSNIYDYTPNRRSFNIVGTVRQTGTTVASGFYSNDLGFVAGFFTDFSGDPHVQAVAMSHQDQLPILVTPATKYYKQNATDGKFYPTDKPTAVEIGKEVRAAGKYSYVDQTWRLYASFVWQPQPGLTQGAMQWLESAAQTTPPTETSPNVFEQAQYDGPIYAGDGQLNPGNIRLTLDWTWDQVNNAWLFDGTWLATHSQQGAGFVGGTISGSWAKSSAALTGTMILNTGGGRWLNVTGTGLLLNGTAVADPLTDLPPTTFEANWKLTVFRS